MQKDANDHQAPCIELTLAKSQVDTLQWQLKQVRVIYVYYNIFIHTYIFFFTIIAYIFLLPQITFEICLQVEASNQMYKAVLEQVSKFLEKAHTSLNTNHDKPSLPIKNRYLN